MYVACCAHIGVRIVSTRTARKTHAMGRLAAVEDRAIIYNSQKIREQKHKDITTAFNASYNKERDYREKVYQRDLQRMRLVVGSLAMLNVAAALNVGHVQAGRKGIPVVVQNVFDEGVLYGIKAKGALIKERVNRGSLHLMVNESLRTEIEQSPLTTFARLTIREYLAQYWVTPTSAPACKCNGGCKTNSCPCRAVGFKCGALCHKNYYTRHGTCKNYK